jgi:hypothetical protein
MVFEEKIYFNYSLDCELPPDGPFGGPKTWDIAEKSVTGFIEVMEAWGLLAGASLFVYPDVARKQKGLYRQLAEEGVEIALHLNGMRYSKMKTPAWLGSLSYADQYEALRMAKEDLEDVTGKTCLGYRACYTSANDDTYPILEALGFLWASTTAVGTYKPEIYACWKGCWPFPHYASRKNRLIPGDVKVYEIPKTRGRSVFFENNPDRPLDLRAETRPEIIGHDGEKFRTVIMENLEEMEKCNQPIRVIMSGSHNTGLFGDRNALYHNNLRLFCHIARECCEALGYELIPSSYLSVAKIAQKLDVF